MGDRRVKNESAVHEEFGDYDIKYAPPMTRDFSAPYLEDLPRFQDEKPFIGPKSSSGNTRVLYRQQLDGYEFDDKERARMDGMGLPSGFSFGHMAQIDPRQTRGFKKTFYCNICLIELNSEDTMISHMKGVKHMRKSLTNREKCARLGREPSPEVVPISNPEPTKKKVPIRLHDKIKETSIPIVGLEFLKEYIPESDSEMEPHYECSICECQGQANCMFSHLQGQKHRSGFFNKLLGANPVKRSQAELLELAREYDENDGVCAQIKTIVDDEVYPWPAGKEPWSELKGGNGIAPDGARVNYGRKPMKKETVEVPDINNLESMKSKIKPRSKGLPLPEHLKKPTSLSDSQRMFELGSALIKMVLDHPGSRVKHNERSVVQTCLSVLEVTALQSQQQSKRTSVNPQSRLVALSMNRELPARSSHLESNTTESRKRSRSPNSSESSSDKRHSLSKSRSPSNGKSTYGNEKRSWSSQRDGIDNSQDEIVRRSSPTGRNDEKREGKRRSYEGYDSYQEERYDRVNRSRRSPSSRYDERIDITRRSYENYDKYRDNQYDRKFRRSFDDTSNKSSSDIKREHVEGDGYHEVERSSYRGRSELNFGQQRTTMRRQRTTRDGAY